jgi:hypothetical protein
MSTMTTYANKRNYGSFTPNQEYYYSDLEFPEPAHRQTQIRSITPHTNDVMMGRGGNNNKWCGNEQLRDLARLQVERYQKADKKGKSNISIHLVSQVHALSPPGRFLKRDSNTLEWKIVPDGQAREKASQCLRDAVSDAKKGNPKKTPEAKHEQERRVSVDSSETVQNKHKMTRCQIDMSAMYSSKRLRVIEPQKDDASTIFTVPPHVVADFLENTPVSSLFEDDYNILVDLDCEPALDFELFDANTLLDEHDLLFEPLAEISVCCSIQ